MTIDVAIQGALDRIVDEGGNISYQPKPLSEISTERPNTGDVDMNNKRLVNLSSVPGLSIDEILATPNVAVSVSTMSSFTTASLALNTAYCGPLFPTMDVKGKRVVNAADPELILPDDPNAIEKTNQLVTVGFQNAHTLTSLPEDRNNFYARGKLIYDLEETFVYKDSDVRTVPDPLEQNVFNVDEELIAKYDSQAVNLGALLTNTIALDYETRTKFDARNKKLIGVTTEALDNQQLAEVIAGNESEETKELLSQATTVQYALEHTVHAAVRDPLDTSAPANAVCFDSALVNIQNGRAAVLDKDYVIKEQAVVEEPEDVGWIENDPVPGLNRNARFVEFSDERIVFASNVKEPVGGHFIVNSNPPRIISEGRQLANVNYVTEKCRLKG